MKPIPKPAPRARRSASENWPSEPSRPSEYWKPRSTHRGWWVLALVAFLVAFGAGLYFYLKPAKQKPECPEIVCLYSATDDTGWREFVQTLRGVIAEDKSLKDNFFIDDDWDNTRECRIKDKRGGKGLVFRWEPATSTAEKIKAAKAATESDYPPVALLLPDNSVQTEAVLLALRSYPKKPVALVTAASNDDLLFDSPRSVPVFRFCAPNAVQAQMVTLGLKQRLSGPATGYIVSVANHRYSAECANHFRSEFTKVSGLRLKKEFTFPDSLDADFEQVKRAKDVVMELEEATKTGWAVIAVPIRTTYEAIGKELDTKPAVKDRVIVVSGDWLTSDFERPDPLLGYKFNVPPYETLVYSHGRIAKPTRRGLIGRLIGVSTPTPVGATQKSAQEARLVFAVLSALQPGSEDHDFAEALKATNLFQTPSSDPKAPVVYHHDWNFNRHPRYDFQAGCWVFDQNTNQLTRVTK